MTATPRVLDLRVLAEDETGLKYEWHVDATADMRLSHVAAEWARAHGCNPTAVGLEDEMGAELPLEATPSTLGWLHRDIVRITAFPQDEDSREQVAAEDIALRPLDVDNVVGESAESTNPQDDSHDTSVIGRGECSESRGTTQEDEEPATPGEDNCAAQAEEAVPPALSAGEQRSQEESDTPPVAKSKDSSREHPAALSEDKAPKASTKAKTKQTAKGGTAQGKAKAKAKSAAEKKKENTKPKSKPNQQVGPPSGADKIKFIPNPKREGSAAHGRYEKYKKAKTVEQALKMGAQSGDIAFDFQRGFLLRV